MFPWRRVILNRPFNRYLCIREQKLPIGFGESELICSSCTNRLCSATDLFLFTWKSSIHLSTITGSILQQIKCDRIINENQSEIKKDGFILKCIECESAIGTIQSVKGETRALLNAKKLSFNLPQNVMPVISASAYPMESISFRSWEELYKLLINKKDTLGKAIGVLVKDQNLAFPHRITVFEQFNQKILEARDISDVLDIVNDEISSLNNSNLCTAFHRISLLYHEAQLYLLQSKKKTKKKTNRFYVSKNKTFSEAPEDQLFIEHQNFTSNLQANEECLQIQSEKFSILISEIEKRMENGIYLFSPFNITTVAYSLARIGLPRKKLLKLIIEGCSSNLDRFNPESLSTLSWSYASIGIFNHHTNIWHEEFFDLISKQVIQNLSLYTINQLSLIAWSFACIENFNLNLFQMIFSSKQMVFSSLSKENINQLTQVLLSLELEKPNVKLNLHLNLYTKETRKLINEENIISSDLHKNLSNILNKMKIEHKNEYITKEGYSIDIVIIEKKIAIEVNGPIHYNAFSKQLRGSSLFKYRHLKILGWKVILIPYYEWKLLLTNKMKKNYISQLLENTNSI